MTLSRLALVVAILLPACRRNVAELPPPVPVDTEEVQTRLDGLERIGESVRRYEGFVRIRGQGPDGGFSARLVVIFRRPHALRVELLGAFGSTRWSAVANESGITVVFPGPNQYVEEEDSADVVGRLLGVRLSSGEVMAILSGIGAPLDAPVVSAYRQGSLTVARLASGVRVELDEDGQIAVVQTPRYRVSYPTPWKRRRRHVPDSIRLETDTLQATLTPESVDVNIRLAAEAFAIEIPDDAERLRPVDVAGEAVFVVTQEPPKEPK